MKRPKIVWVIMLILFFTGIGSFAQADSDLMLRIGVQYGAAATGNYSVDFMSGITLSTVVGGKRTVIGNLPSESHLDFQRNDLYVVTGIQGFGTKDEVDFLALSRGLQPVGYYYSGHLRPIFAVYTTREEAQGKLDALQAQFPDLSLGLVEPQKNQVKAVGLAATLIYADSGPIVFSTSEETPYYQVNNKRYRSGLMIQGAGTTGGLNHVNVQHLETYLYGVLPKEMAYNWPREALKAQAVAARNYAMQNVNKHKTYGFDVCATTDCQVYGGVESEKAECSAAVDETRGTLIYFNGLPISAFYHSNSGGVTENSENVWSAVLNYIRGTQDQYSLGAPNSDWMLSFTKEELTAALLKTGYDVGTIYDIRIDRRTINGRVSSVSVVGAKGTFVFEKEKFRTALGGVQLKSMLFDIQKGDKIAVLSQSGQAAMGTSGLYALSAAGLKPLQMPIASYNGYQTTFKSTGTKDYTFVGHGYGHGLGMSQWGAKKMAELGYNYVDILSFYYNGVVVQ